MAKGAYIGVDGKARKIKKAYIGVDGKARKIKKAYIGIGGVARPCWSSGELAYYGTITNLRKGTYNLAATTVGNYALFAGGYGWNDDVRGSTNTVTAYNNTLTRSSPSDLNKKTNKLTATTVGNYALFGGGDGGSAAMTSYSTSLTRGTPEKLNVTSSADVNGCSATTIANYALFAGGGTEYMNKAVTSYDTSLTKGTPTELTTARDRPAATTIGNYALFMGGYVTSGVNTVDAYDTSLTRSTPTVLSYRRYDAAATSVGNYALIAGGYNNGTSYGNYGRQNTVEVYNTSLTLSAATNLQIERTDLTATTVGEYAIFAGGQMGPSSQTYDISSHVDVYNASLTRTIGTNLSEARKFLAATSVGNYALIGGGFYGSGSDTYSSDVDVYVVA